MACIAIPFVEQIERNLISVAEVLETLSGGQPLAGILYEEPFKVFVFEQIVSCFCMSGEVSHLSRSAPYVNFGRLRIF